MSCSTEWIAVDPSCAQLLDGVLVGQRRWTQVSGLLLRPALGAFSVADSTIVTGVLVLSSRRFARFKGTASSITVPRPHVMPMLLLLVMDL